ncbi:hypothetical protein DFR26_1363 [Paraperlucidibaca baekdonensis]|uniref:Lipoprotein n=1 Tax=Paraperlucidibaca baekdonensis TaxID=748120 RepID=A0A3E0H2P8_9GAMM|nr:hypothetical protein [Paraperlucidibaca baekdonensis]REH37588.1 hypothetical protein DFR26_1363 [Paraperlucidibaca baekdonensis]
MQIKKVAILAAVAATLAIAGCAKKEEAAPMEAPAVEEAAAPVVEEAEAMAEEAAPVAEEAPAEEAAAQ